MFALARCVSSRVEVVALAIDRKLASSLPLSPRATTSRVHDQRGQVVREGLYLVCRILTKRVYAFGTFRSNSSSHALADASDGMRQSPRGDNAPPALTLGPFGIAVRLNCWVKKRL